MIERELSVESEAFVELVEALGEVLERKLDELIELLTDEFERERT